jgi:hypothetical protein
MFGLSPDQVFEYANMAVIPFWLLLALAPRWSGTNLLVHSVAIPVVLGLTYVWYFANGAFFGPNVPKDAAFGTLEGVMAFFTVKEAVVAGWVHYLVFDLFVGAWIARDAVRRGINQLIVAPILFFTLMLGPIGLLMYAAARGGMHGTFTLDEAK